MGRLLCKLGFHKWLRVYEDEQETFYSCRRYMHCDAELAIEKGAR